MDTDKVYTKRIYTAGTAAAAVCISIATVATVFSKEIVTVREILLPAFFTACCVFMVYFYIDCKRELFSKQRYVLHITALCLILSFAGICIEAVPSYLPLFVLAVVFLAAVSDMGLALLVLSSCLMYGFIFRGVSFDEYAVSFLMAAIISVLIANTSTLASMLISCQIAVTLFVVIVLLKNNFAFSSIWNLKFLFALLYYIGVTVIAFYLRNTFIRLGFNKKLQEENAAILRAEAVEAAAKENKNAKNRKAKEEDKSVKANKAFKDNEQKLKKAEKTIEEKDNRIKKIEKSLDEKEQRIKKAEKALEDNELKLKKAEKALEEKKLELDKSKKSLEDKALELGKAEKELKDRTLKLDKTEKELQDMSVVLDKAKKDIEERDELLEAATKPDSSDDAHKKEDERAKLERERADRLESETKRLERELDEAKADRDELRTRTSELEQRVEFLDLNRVYRVSDVIDPGFEYCERLSQTNPSLLKHCDQIGNYAAKACDLIGADSMLAYAIGLYHEAAKALGTNDVEAELTRLHLPEHLIQAVVAVKTVPDKPILRETGVVILTEEIRNTVMYAKNKKLEVTVDKIVSNVLKAKKEQGLLRLAGLSVEELQLLRMFFAEFFE